MAPFQNESTPCGLTVGQILTPDEAKAPRCGCSAIIMQNASGPIYFPELGSAPERRHRVVTVYHYSTCARLMNIDKCPELNPIDYSC